MCDNVTKIDKGRATQSNLEFMFVNINNFLKDW